MNTAWMPGGPEDLQRMLVGRGIYSVDRPLVYPLPDGMSVPNVDVKARLAPYDPKLPDLAKPLLARARRELASETRLRGSALKLGHCIRPERTS